MHSLHVNISTNILWDTVNKFNLGINLLQIKKVEINFLNQNCLSHCIMFNFIIVMFVAIFVFISHLFAHLLMIIM
jgi:hypothetical protein